MIYMNLKHPIALGIYWRIYGNPKPFETRQPVENYTQWHGDKHIKSIIVPTFVKSFPDPHKAELINEKKGMYIDENNNQILEPTGVHTSNNIWIKHVFHTKPSKNLQKKCNVVTQIQEKKTALGTILSITIACA
jgi:hypothetical protein